VLFSEPKIPQPPRSDGARDVVAFQCSSASRKFLKHLAADAPLDRHGFSALQRAENSSTREVPDAPGRRQSFSALQRAENSSICGWQ